MRVRILIALFVAYVVATAVHIGWILAHEPFSFDAWNVAVDTDAQPFSVGNFFRFWAQQYTESNPRLGQPLTYLTYKLVGVGEVAMAASFVAISLAVVVLALGRWPWRRARDIALWAIALGFGWFVLPEIGRNMFCRAYGANYVFTAAVQLWFLVPLRLARDSTSLPRCIAYGAFGLVAGLCNEHTGPALVLLLGTYGWWLRRAKRSPRFAWFGAVGVLVGFAAIFFAPGQGSRYGGLAQQASLPQRLIDRGVSGNFDIVRDFLTYAMPLLALIVVVLIVSHLGKPLSDERQQGRAAAMRMIAIALAFGTVIAVTLFVSPKLGARFHFVSMSLLLAGFLALVDASIERTRNFAPLILLAVAASIYAGAKTITLFARVHAQSEARMAELAKATPGSVYVADAWQQVGETWWFIGDDFRDLRKREMVAKYFGLARVYFRGYEKTAPLGSSGIRVVPRYFVEGSDMPAEDFGFEFGITRGFDLAGMHAGTLSSVALLQRRIAPAQLSRLDVAVEFVADPPPLPHPLLVARWTGGTLEGWIATIERKGTTRRLKLPPDLGTKDLYMLRVGNELRTLDASASYTPWGKGVYWAIACDDRACWVIAATRS
jgi:hypothetical protein